MEIVLTKWWGGYKAGTSFSMGDGQANMLIRRNMARVVNPLPAAIVQPEPTPVVAAVVSGPKPTMGGDVADLVGGGDSQRPTPHGLSDNDRSNGSKKRKGR